MSFTVMPSDRIIASDSVIVCTTLILQHQHGKVLGVGLCCPGIIDTARGVMTQAANFPGWEDVYLAEMVTRGTGLPVWLEVW